MRKPDFIIVGAVKSGTTSLFHYLNQHPSIFLPKSKELSYFARSEGAGSIATMEEYLTFFSAAREFHTVGEVSTAYLYSATAAKEIASHIGPDVKIIIMLRNPVDMAYSLWGQNTRDGGETLALEDAIAAESQRIHDPDFRKAISGWIFNYAYVERARYAGQVKRYLEIFGKERVAIYIFEEFFGNIEASFKNLLEFLGVDPEFKLNHYKKHNPQGEVRSRLLHKLYFENSNLAEWIRPLVPARLRRAIMMILYDLNTRISPRVPLSDEQYNRLMKIFEADIRELEEVLGRKLTSIWTCRRGD